MQTMSRFSPLILLLLVLPARGQEVHGIADFAFSREVRKLNVVGQRYAVSGYALWMKNKDGKLRVFLQESNGTWGYAEVRDDQVSIAEKLPREKPTTTRVIVEGEYLGMRNTTRAWFRDAKIVRVFPPE